MNRNVLKTLKLFQGDWVPIDSTSEYCYIVRLSRIEGESWKGYRCGTKSLCDNGVSSFLRCISYETQRPQAPLEENIYGMYHILLSEASCEG